MVCYATALYGDASGWISQELVNYAGGMSAPANLSTQEPRPCWSHHWPVVSTLIHPPLFLSHFWSLPFSGSRRETIMEQNELRFRRRFARNISIWHWLHIIWLLMLSSRLHKEDTFQCNCSMLELSAKKLTMWWSRGNILPAITKYAIRIVLIEANLT